MLAKVFSLHGKAWARCSIWKAAGKSVASREEIVFICAKHRSYKPIFTASLALICGGGLGNLTDRAAYGYVIDMFDFGFFPVFNVADICVVAGCGLMIVYLIVFENRNGSSGKNK